MQSNMLMQAKNAVGFNTAGAASSVPDFGFNLGLQNPSQNPPKSIEKNKLNMKSAFELDFDFGMPDPHPMDFTRCLHKLTGRVLHTLLKHKA